MASYHEHWWLDNCNGNATWVLPGVMSNSWKSKFLIRPAFYQLPFFNCHLLHHHHRQHNYPHHHYHHHHQVFYCYIIPPWAVSYTPQPTVSEASFTPTSEAGPTCTSLLPVKPVAPLPAMPDPPLPACSQQSEIVRQVRVSMSEKWDDACQSFKVENFRVERASVSVVNVSMWG